ncbi:uncharacterized protein LOC127182021 [Labeo rohita]|uniref:uncharacterized protein LOC127182021 n=1 Tax=Labeo rohita TaxID=84645 RepID=UPI0021E32DD5|nr:uncharacterized protein LOC127182021 [Labeo rohita]
MNKILAILSLTAFLCCCGVQSAESYNDLKQQIYNSGSVVFLDFLKKVRTVTEKLVRDDQFRKSRISIQGHMKSLREFAKPLKNTESDRGSQDNSAILPQRVFTLMTDGTFGATIRDVFDRFFTSYMKIYRETLKDETMADIWKEVESNYLPGAPPIYSKPMQFFSHLLAKAVVKSQLVNMLDAGVNTVVEIGKIDFNQLHEEVQMVMNQIRQKAFEISILERQKEKNDFLVSLRTASGLIVFYWDKGLEHFESPAFYVEFMDSLKKWAELTKLENPSETYHALLQLNTWHDLSNWMERYYGQFFKAAAEEYVNCGSAVLGFNRFSQSNRAVARGTIVYSLHVYKKLSEVGFGISEINRFLHRVRHISLTLEGNDIYSNEKTILERCIHSLFAIPEDVIEKVKQKHGTDNQLLLPLRVIRTVFLEIWTNLLAVEDFLYGRTEYQQPQSKLNHARNIAINELLKSNVFTRKQLEEAPKNFVQAVRQILEKLKQYTDLVDGFDEIIDPTVLALERTMHRADLMFHDVWDMLFE